MDFFDNTPELSEEEAAARLLQQKAIFDERMSDAAKLKSEGNEFFKAKNYKEALKKYRYVFAYTNGFVTKNDKMSMYSGNAIADPSMIRELNQMKIDTNNNMANSYLQFGDFQKALKFSQRSVDLDSSNVKALFRKCQALFGLKHYSDCHALMTQLVQLEPDNKTFQKELTRYARYAAAAEKKQREREKKAYSGMFG